MNTDRERIRAVLGGRLEVYEEMMREHQVRAYNLALGVVKDSHVAEAVCIESFEKAYRNLGKFNGNALFGTWLYRIVLNTARNHYKADKKRRDRYTPLDDIESRADESIRQPSSELLDKEETKMVRTAVGRLPEKLKRAWTLFATEDFRLAEIAEIENCSVGTIKSRIFSARKKLKKSLARYFEEWNL